MDKRRCAASVRMVVEFSMIAGDLLPGAPLARMREGTLGHQARQRAVADARSEVTVRGELEGEVAVLEVSGRIDMLYERDGVPVVEEIKLAPPEGVPQEAAPVHRAQAVCYGHMIGAPLAVIRVLYVRVDGTEVASFEEKLDDAQMRAEFVSFATPYLHMAEARMLWGDTRDASIAALPFPFAGYRQGQRDMAVQTYWAVKSRRRLFAQAPTGTGKTVATMYPALKALGEGLTGQLFYLTARTTVQQNAAQALSLMRGQGLRVRALVLTAKEKICPYREAYEGEAPWRCDVLTCPCAKGYYDRLPDALAAMRARDDWSRAAVEAVSAEHMVCPFEFGLALCEEADIVIGDYNYAFDPGARIRRIFMWNTNLTLLLDEAHNLPDRARGMLSAALESRALREIRRSVGKLCGRKKPLYLALTALIGIVEAAADEVMTRPPETLRATLERCTEAVMAVIGEVPLGDLTRILAAATGAVERFDDCYSVHNVQDGKHRTMNLMCLDPAPYLAECTRKLRGCIYFSATLTPLAAWRDVIGGVEEDGLLALPSPFPEENLLVLRCPLSTKYRDRDATVERVADAIVAMARARAGNYLACFPSYAYLARVQEAIEARALPDIALHVQRGGMDDASRAAYLDAFAPRAEGALLGMVVLGGVFGEGIDLPGDRLSGVAVVGVGLPQICPERELLRGYFDEKAGTGFAQAYRYPGMNKVLQAVGRVIRTERDQGVALLIDDRFLTQAYAALMPPWWGQAEMVRGGEEIAQKMEGFWDAAFSRQRGSGD